MMKFVWVVPAALIAAGCGGSNQPKDAAKEVKKELKPVEYFHVDAATAGKLHGRIVYRGPKPVRKVIDMSVEAACQQAHGGKPVYDEPVVVGKDAGLANAFVYIQTGLEGKTFEPVKDPITLDQHGCQFVPHALGIRAGQPLDVKNSDTVSHNIHPMPQNNREWNEQQSPGSPDAQHRFARTEIMIPVKCNVHQWMRAYIGVMENPYFVVTGPDGSFELNNVPPGDYTVAVWHEKLGDQTKQVHLPASATEAVEFLYK
jgi:plastocyanin